MEENVPAMDLITCKLNAHPLLSFSKLVKSVFEIRLQSCGFRDTLRALNCPKMLSPGAPNYYKVQLSCTV